jgi:hypothetical protein
MRFHDRPAGLRRLRPRRSLFWQALSGTLAFLVPVSIVLYALTVPDGPWYLVVALEVVVILAFGLSYLSYLGVGFWIGPEGIAERGFFGRGTWVPRERIASIVLLNTYRDGEAPVPQLFICGADGDSLLRMRGQFWSPESMRVVYETLELVPERTAGEVSRADLLDNSPGLLYWFERHPVIARVIAISVITIAGGLGTLVYVRVTGDGMGG